MSCWFGFLRYSWKRVEITDKVTNSLIDATRDDEIPVSGEFHGDDNVRASDEIVAAIDVYHAVAALVVAFEDFSFSSTEQQRP